MRLRFFIFTLNFLLCIGGEWIEILPPPMNYCPQSPLSYDCPKYQANVWNKASLAFLPSSSASFENQDHLNNTSSPICVVYLPGTGGTAFQSAKGLLSSISLLNYHLISLSYVSTSYSVLDMNNLCGDQLYNGNINTTTCINQFHASMVYGSQSSTIWGIHHNDSISKRLLFTIQSLAQKNPSWNQFLSSSPSSTSGSFQTRINWDRIIIVGHSQGAGHAGYLAATTRTHGVVLLSGIQDCCSYSTYMNTNLYSWHTPSSRLSILFHYYEDLKGIILSNTGQYLPNISPTEYIAPSSSSSTSFSFSSLQSRYFYVKYSPQNSDSCKSSRPEHSSTAVDSCSPLDDSQSTGYLYQSLWQYLITHRSSSS